MELRYVKRGEAFMPEYQDKDGNWNGITVDDLNGKFSPLYKITWALQEQCYNIRSMLILTKEKELMFDEEIYVCAFLGAFKSFHTNRITKFDAI